MAESATERVQRMLRELEKRKAAKRVAKSTDRLLELLKRATKNDG